MKLFKRLSFTVALLLATILLIAALLIFYSYTS